MIDAGIGGKVKCSDGLGGGSWGGLRAATAAASAAGAADPLFAFPPLLQTGARRNARRLAPQDFACACVFCLNAKTFRQMGRQSRRGLTEPFVGFSASFRGKCGDSAVGGDVA